MTWHEMKCNRTERMNERTNESINQPIKQCVNESMSGFRDELTKEAINEGFNECSESMNQWMTWISEGINEGVNQWKNERMSERMNGWDASLLSYFFSELLPIWVNSSLSRFCFELPPSLSHLFCSFCDPIHHTGLPFAQLLQSQPPAARPHSRSITPLVWGPESVKTCLMNRALATVSRTFFRQDHGHQGINRSRIRMLIAWAF